MTALVPGTKLDPYVIDRKIGRRGMGEIYRAKDTRLKRGLKAAASVFGPPSFAIEGKEIVCPHCGNKNFAKGTAQLNTAGMTFHGLDWAKEFTHTLMYTQCGRIEWFGQKPSKL